MRRTDLCMRLLTLVPWSIVASSSREANWLFCSSAMTRGKFCCSVHRVLFNMQGKHASTARLVILEAKSSLSCACQRLGMQTQRAFFSLIWKHPLESLLWTVCSRYLPTCLQKCTYSTEYMHIYIQTYSFLHLGRYPSRLPTPAHPLLGFSRAPALWVSFRLDNTGA